jgi:hypothetical protein
METKREKETILVAEMFGSFKRFSGCYFNIGNNGVEALESSKLHPVMGFSSISFKSVGMVQVQPRREKSPLTISAEDNLTLLEVAWSIRTLSRLA